MTSPIEISRESTRPSLVRPAQITLAGDTLLEYYQNVPGAEFQLSEYSHHWLVIQDQTAPATMMVGSEGDDHDLSGKLDENGIIFIPAFRKTCWNFSRVHGCMHLLIPDRILFEVMEYWNIPFPFVNELSPIFGASLPRITYPLHVLMNELKRYGDCDRFMFEEQLYSVATGLLDAHIRNEVGGNAYVANNRQPGKLDTIQLERVKIFIWDQIDQKIYLSDVAAQVGLSPYHFSRLFRQSVGFTLTQYIQMSRVAWLRGAISKLSQTREVNLADLSNNSGFFDQAHMTKTFYRWLNMTPMEYAKAVCL